MSNEGEVKKGKRTVWYAIGCLGILAVSMTCFAIATLDGSGDATAVPARVVAPPFGEIESKVESMTEVQWKPYLDTLEGQWVTDWTGWIVDVDADLSDQYKAWVDMDSPDELFSAQDVYVLIGEEIALQLQKGAKVRFSGRIERASEFLGSVSIHLEDATLAIAK